MSKIGGSVKEKRRRQCPVRRPENEIRPDPGTYPWQFQMSSACRTGDNRELSPFRLCLDLAAELPNRPEFFFDQ